ncbi:MAG: hypothetical protein FWB80_12665 [Defluviitaleaceae bacterium]|nr:hypothetical protein [Defluviitaleaceae bacterium]
MLQAPHGECRDTSTSPTHRAFAHETIDNAINANEKRLSTWGYLRKDIIALNRTADKFYEKHEDEIRTHENALRDLKDYKRPLFTVKEIDEEIAKGKNANVQNAKYYRTAKAEHTRFTTVHRKLYAVNSEHKPKAPQRQKQRSQDKER